MTKQNDSAVPGQLKITIHKSQLVASISGGEPGPGQYVEGGGIKYHWKLPIDNMLPEYSPDSEKTEVINALNYIIATIGSVAQSSCQSFSMSGSGGYDGVQLTLTGACANMPTSGQLQSNGAGIDISGAPNLDKLFVNRYTPEADGTSTSRYLILSIEE
ncbi:hypothetical protein [Aliikangiella sp. IMCC44359]|uniref:hypothetical protein n=1 Tax=Aliikangiella sp. IMCC44359 TaxID=3459125 RepID=UPI00403A7EFB